MYKETLIKKLSADLEGDILSAFVSAAELVEETEDSSLLDNLMEIKESLLEGAGDVTKDADKGDQKAEVGTDETGKKKKKKAEDVWDDEDDQEFNEENEDEDEDEEEEEKEDEEKEEEEEEEEIEEKKKSVKESVLDRVVSEEISIEEDVNALFEGEELSEDFKSKATTIFEAAVASKVSAYKEAVNEAIESVVEEEVDSISEELTAKIDQYLDYVVEEWMQENEIAIEHGLRTEVTEGFIAGLKNLFMENYVEIPEGSENLLDATISEKEDLEEEFETQVQKNIDLVEEIKELKKGIIISEITKGLTETEAEKLSDLAEEVRFSDVETFTTKISQLKESYFKKSVKTGEGVDMTEGMLEEENKVTDKAMKSYADSISRYLK